MLWIQPIGRTGSTYFLTCVPHNCPRISYYRSTAPLISRKKKYGPFHLFLFVATCFSKTLFLHRHSFYVFPYHPFHLSLILVDHHFKSIPRSRLFHSFPIHVLLFRRNAIYFTRFASSPFVSRQNHRLYHLFHHCSP